MSPGFCIIAAAAPASSRLAAPWRFESRSRLASAFSPARQRRYAISRDGGAGSLESEQSVAEVEVLEPVELVLDDRFRQEDEEDSILPAAAAAAAEDRRFLLNVLDACLETKDMKLVAKTYAYLRRKGLIPNFGRYKTRVFDDGERLITPTTMKEITGLEASKLSPKKWGVSGPSAAILFSIILLQGVLSDNGIDLRPFFAFALCFALVDSIYLGGVGVAQIQSFWLPHRRRIMVHEAGHVVIAYLLGCPLRGVVLDAFQAMRLGIQGQAGTQFWDEMLEDELKLGRLNGATIDRYTMVLFAGMAAEGLVFGEAEGGENDENLYLSLTSMLSPPWSMAKKGNQARWAILQSFKLLKQYRNVHTAVTKALEKNATMSTIVKSIEDAMNTDQSIVSSDD